MTYFWLQLRTTSRLAVRSACRRRSASLAAVFGFIVVSSAMLAVLSTTTGIVALMKRTGSTTVAMITARGTFSEGSSNLSPELPKLVIQVPHLLDQSDLAVSPEILAAVAIPRNHGNGVGSILLRGVEPAGFVVHQEVTLIDGRRFVPGRDEVIVGTALLTLFESLGKNSFVAIGNRRFRIVGVFAASGGERESEIWGDRYQIGSALGIPLQINVVNILLPAPKMLQVIGKFLETVPGPALTVQSEASYFTRLGTALRDVLLFPGVLIIGTMTAAAVLAAVNIVQSSVHSRMRELATLRAIGFDSAPIVLSVVLEAALFGLVGGIVGAAIVAASLHGSSTVTSNGLSSFAFRFQLSPIICLGTLSFAICAGILGGIWPAISFSRMEPARALAERG